MRVAWVLSAVIFVVRSDMVEVDGPGTAGTQEQGGNSTDTTDSSGQDTTDSKQASGSEEHTTPTPPKPPLGDQLIDASLVTVPKLELEGKYSFRFCQVDDMTCKKENVVERSTVTGTINQCKALCLRSREKKECASVFWEQELRKCHLQSSRCIPAKMKNANGTTLIRLIDGERCPPGSEKYEYKVNKMSNKFCGKRDVSCLGRNLYPKPWIMSSYSECLVRCARLSECVGVDYFTFALTCELKKVQMCEEDELIPKLGNVNYLRLENLEEECPLDRLDECPPHSSRRGGSECICDNGYGMVNEGCAKLPDSGCLGYGDEVELPLDEESASQSTTNGEYDAGKGVDAEIVGADQPTCARTLHGTTRWFQWWSVSLKQTAVVKRVEVTHLVGCCGIVAARFDVLVDDLFCGPKAKSPDTLTGPTNIAQIVCKQPVCGKVVIIREIVNEPLGICDVTVIGQLAVSIPRACTPRTGITILPIDIGSARQDSVAAGYDADRAVDLIFNGDFKVGGCTHTEGGHLSWWKVNLAQKAIVHVVYLLNRQDCCHDRLKDFKILVDSELCNFHRGSFQGGKNIVCTNPLCGTQLTVEMTHPDPLTLCDVRVYGQLTALPNPVTSNCKAFGDQGSALAQVELQEAYVGQINTFGNFHANLAIDGNDGSDMFNGATCTHTEVVTRKELPWWRVIFKKHTLVSYVEIQNRLRSPQRLADFAILIDNDLCMFHPGHFIGRKKLECETPLCGSEVVILLTKTDIPLTLCDVDVWGVY